MRYKEFITEGLSATKIISIFKKIWNQKYPNVKIYTNYDPTTEPSSELSFFTDPEMRSTYTGTDGFQLSIGVHLTNIDLDNNERKEPFTAIMVGHGYNGGYTGVIMPFFQAIYQAGPNSKYKELEIAGDGSSGQWEHIAKRLKAHYYGSPSSFIGAGESYDYTEE